MAGMNRASAVERRWRRIIREQRTSGLTVAEYCRRIGVSTWSFYSWRLRLRAERETRAQFVEVKATRPSTIASTEGPSHDPSGIELQLSGGRCVIVRPGFDHQALRDLLHVLEANPAAPERAEAGA